MDYRLASILAPEAASTAGTKTLDINIADVISRISIQFKGLNDGTEPTAHPAKMISKIELVDGSDVLFSLSGVEAQALNYYDQGRMPHNVLNYLNNVYAISTYHLDFGRFLYDEQFALDPTKFTNPQLKISHNKALGGTSPDAGELSIFAHVFDEKKPTPTGFLMSKEQYSYTLVASANEHIDLAVDLPYRKLLIASMATTLQPWQQYNKIKLSQDNDRKVIINGEQTSNLLKLLRQWPTITENITARLKNGTQTIHCGPSYERLAVLTGMAADSDAYLTDTYGGAIAIADGAASTANIIVNGLNPHGTFCLPFGKQESIDDLFTPGVNSNLRLSLTAGGSASGSVEITSQQLRPY
ncbi:MAG: hypothetical protein JRI34_02715 [Deltaproteobacteria bacterium]|nr:hypothetical protein [Deltaproteobacteria bacterium]